MSTLPFQGKGLKPSGTQHSCFGNCAELCLKVIKGHLDFCCVGVSSKRSICADAGRDRITAIVACSVAVLPEGTAEPSGFFVAFSWHSGQAGFGLPAFDCLMTKTSLTTPLALR